MMNIKRGVILLSLLVLLIGCASPKPGIIRVPYETIQIEKESVPAELLRPCREPDLDALETTGDLERAAVAGLAAARCGNEDKAKIREWQTE
jgi:hypothetical protein